MSKISAIFNKNTKYWVLFSIKIINIFVLLFIEDQLYLKSEFMKENIYGLLNKITSPILVLNQNNIVYFNNFFVESFLKEYYFDTTSVAKFNKEWEIKKSLDELIIVHKYSKIKYNSSFITEFRERENGEIEQYQVYKFQESFNASYSLDSSSRLDVKRKFYEKQKKIQSIHSD